MRLFIQISVSGFKIFEPDQFTHVCDNGKFALMSEIASTQNGDHSFHTHITRSEDHGIPVSISRLFSSPYIDFLLQDSVFDGIDRRVFYVSRNGFTVDSLNRTCEMSFLLISENGDDCILNKLAYLICSEDDTYIKENFQKVLCKDVVDSQLVLLYNENVFREIIEYVKSKNIEEPNLRNLNALLKSDTQLMIFGDNCQVNDISANMASTLNDKPYWCFSLKYLPICKHLFGVPDSITSLKKDATDSGQTYNGNSLLGKLVKSIGQIIDKHN